MVKEGMSVFMVAFYISKYPLLLQLIPSPCRPSTSRSGHPMLAVLRRVPFFFFFFFFCFCFPLPSSNSSTASMAATSPSISASRCRFPKKRHRAVSGSLWCCNKAPRGFQLLLMLVSWFFLLLLLCVLHVEGNEVINYGLFGSQETVDPSLDINDKVSASHRDVFITIDEGIDVPMHQRESQLSGTDNLFEASKFALELTAQQYFHGIELQPDESIQDSQNHFGSQAGEGQGTSDRNSAASMDKEKKATTLFCFPSIMLSSIRHSSIKAESSFSNQLEKHLPQFEGSISSAPKLAIVPPFLQWGPHPLFSPSVLSLTILNTCNKSGLDIFRPFSTNSQFSMYGFEEITVSPGGMLSVPVVFLPTSLGIIKGFIVVQTSQGGFLIQVQGEGIDSPYQLRPLSSLTGVIGSKLLHSIIFHNPYDKPLHIDEVYAWVKDSHKGVGVLCKRYSVLLEEVPMGHIDCRQVVSDDGSAGSPQATIELMPSGDWIIDPHSSYPIVDLELAITTEIPILGTLCIKVANHRKQIFQNVILPLKVQPLKRRSTSGKVYAVPEVLDFGVLGRNQKIKQAISVVNELDFLLVERIYISSEDNNIIDIEYADGLILRPGTESKVAFITYAGTEERSCWLYNVCYVRNCCQLILQTNATVIKLPYRAVVFHGPSECLSLASSSILRNVHVAMQDLCFKPRPILQVQNTLSVPLMVIRELEKRALALDSQLDDPVAQIDKHGIGSSDSILDTSELLFPMVQISREEIRWVTVKNPSDQPIMIHLIVIPEAEGSYCTSEEPRSNIHCFLSPYTTVEAGLGTSTCEGQGMAIHRGIFSVAEDGVVDALVQPKNKANLGPVVFRPVEQFLWTSLLVIQNNLTGVEWILVQGLGGSSDLTFLDGDDPVQVLQLDLNLTRSPPSSTGLIKQRIHDFLDKAAIKSSCNKRIAKKFLAKNTGNLALQVDSVTFAGGTCDSHGFRLDSCNGFYLSPGQTRQLFVSYQLDFTGVFNRELQFSTSSGMLTVPLRANLALGLLSICQKPSIFLKVEKLLLHVSVIALFSLIIIFIKMLKRERLMASNSHHGSTSSSTNSFSSGDLKISKKGKESGHQRSKSVEPSSPMAYVHSSFVSNRGCYCFGISASICRILALFKSVFNLAVMINCQTKIYKVEFPVGGVTTLNATGHTQQENGCLTNGSYKSAERKVTESVAQEDKFSSKATSQSPSIMSVNVGGLKANGANVAAPTSTMVESFQEQHLPAPVRLTSEPEFLVSPVLLASEPGLLVSPPRTEPQVEQAFSSESQLKKLKSQVSLKSEQIEEKKERGKRKKKRNNVPTMKQEMENGSHSGNSSPSSPATPVHASRPMSPLLPSHTSFHGSKMVLATNGDPQKRHQSYCSMDSEGSSHHEVHPASDLHLKVMDASSVMLQKQASPGLINSQRGPSKDKAKGIEVKDQAGIARTTPVRSKSSNTHNSSYCLGACNPERPSNCKLILTTSATFPGGERNSAWKVSSNNLEESRQPRNFSASSPSLVSLPAAAPLSRAPGTRVARLCEENLDFGLRSIKDHDSLTSARLALNSTRQTGCEKVQESNEFLYDIWGDHFVEIRRGSSHTGFKRCATVEGTYSSQTGSVEGSQSLFAQSAFIRPSSAFNIPVAPSSSLLSPPDSSFSVCSTTDSLFASHRLSPLLSDWVQEE